jgi:type I restriction enzyme, S subunit
MTMEDESTKDTKGEANGLPAGWAWTTVGQVTRSMRNGIYKAADFYAEDGIACLRMYNIEAGRIIWKDIKRMRLTPQELADYELKPGDLLVNRVNSRELVGKAAVIPDGIELCVYESKNIRVRLTDSLVSSKYVGYWFQYFGQKYFSSNAQQTVGMASTNQEQLAAMPIPLPSLREQELVVAKIEELFSRLDAGVAGLKRVQAALKRYRAAVLKAACEGRLVPQAPNDEPATKLLERILAERRARWEADLRAKGKDPAKVKYEEPQGPDTEGLPELPEGWCWVTLGQLAWSVKDGPHYSPKYVAVGIPFVTGGNVRATGVDFSKAKYITPELHEELVKRCRPEKGDILYTKGGTTGIARVNTYDQAFSVWVHVAVLKLSRQIEPYFVQHALNSPFCYAQAQRYTHGVGNQDLGLTRMVKIVLALPSLLEQKRIVSEIDLRISMLDQLEQLIEANLVRGERLRQAMLRRAFEGRLAG